MFPFIDTAPRASPPVVVLGLIAANFAVFLWMQSLPPQMLEATLVHYALIPVRYTDPQLAVSVGLDPSNWMPMLTDMFMHGGWMHIIFNMWFLWIFGPALEARFGRLGFLALYLMGGVTANIVHIATHLDSTEPVLGASGAVAAVIAAYAVSYPWARVLTIVPIGFIPLFIPVPAFLFALRVVRPAGAAGQLRIGLARNGRLGGMVGAYRRLRVRRAGGVRCPPCACRSRGFRLRLRSSPAPAPDHGVAKCQRVAGAGCAAALSRDR